MAGTTITIDADPSGAVDGFARVDKAAQRTSESLDRVGRSAQRAGGDGGRRIDRTAGSLRTLAQRADAADDSLSRGASRVGQLGAALSLLGPQAEGTSQAITRLGTRVGDLADASALSSLALGTAGAGAGGGAASGLAASMGVAAGAAGVLFAAIGGGIATLAHVTSATSDFADQIDRMGRTARQTRGMIGELFAQIDTAVAVGIARGGGGATDPVEQALRDIGGNTEALIREALTDPNRGTFGALRLVNELLEQAVDDLEGLSRIPGALGREQAEWTRAQIRDLASLRGQFEAYEAARMESQESVGDPASAPSVQVARLEAKALDDASKAQQNLLALRELGAVSLQAFLDANAEANEALAEREAELAEIQLEKLKDAAERRQMLAQESADAQLRIEEALEAEREELRARAAEAEEERLSRVQSAVSDVASTTVSAFQALIQGGDEALAAFLQSTGTELMVRGSRYLLEAAAMAFIPGLQGNAGGAAATGGAMLAAGAALGGIGLIGGSGGGGDAVSSGRAAPVAANTTNNTTNITTVNNIGGVVTDPRATAREIARYSQIARREGYMQ